MERAESSFHPSSARGWEKCLFVSLRFHKAAIRLLGKPRKVEVGEPGGQGKMKYSRRGACPFYERPDHPPVISEWKVRCDEKRLMVAFD